MHRLLTVFAALALAGTAYAGGEKNKGSYDHKNHSGEVRKNGSPALSNELKGELVKVEAGTVYVRHMGAIIAFKLTDRTRFEGTFTKKSDLKEGTEIRASFTVQGKTDNVATKISSGDSQPGIGGSGPDVGVERDFTAPTLPERTPGIPLPEELGTQDKRNIF